MFCTKCGNKLADGARFCVKCGNTVNTSSVANTPPPTGIFGGVTPEQMRANTAQGIANQATAEIQASYREPSKIGSQVPPSMATQLPRNNLLIAMIVLSAVTFIFEVVIAGNIVMTLNMGVFIIDVIYSLSLWFYYILVAIALVQGYTYHLSILKISAFIALILPLPDVVFSLRHLYYSQEIFLLASSYVLRSIFAVIFLVFAIQLLKKNAGSVK